MYSGTYYGTPVAVKVIDNRAEGDLKGRCNLEAVLSEQLSHPNVVRTLATYHNDSQVGGAVA